RGVTFSLTPPMTDGKNTSRWRNPDANTLSAWRRTMAQVSLSSVRSPDEASSAPSRPARRRSEVGPSAFLDALDLLQRRGVSQLRLLGGEPTRHPDFPWMLTRAIERGFSVLVHSSGVVPHAVLKKLERLPPDKVTLLLNVVIPGEAWPHELDRQQGLFTRL